MIILNRLWVMKTLKVITKSASLEYPFTEGLPYREIKAALSHIHVHLIMNFQPLFIPLPVPN